MIYYNISLIPLSADSPFYPLKDQDLKILIPSIVVIWI
jgi:hypothetical protein